MAGIGRGGKGTLDAPSGASPKYKSRQMSPNAPPHEETVAGFSRQNRWSAPPRNATRCRMSIALRNPITLEEFLAWEEQQELRYGSDGFEPIAMTGGTLAHDQITFNLR